MNNIDHLLKLLSEGGDKQPMPPARDYATPIIVLLLIIVWAVLITWLFAR